MTLLSQIVIRSQATIPISAGLLWDCLSPCDRLSFGYVSASAILGFINPGNCRDTVVTLLLRDKRVH